MVASLVATYNGLTMGQAPVHIQGMTGAEDLDGIRTGDIDRPDEGVVPGVDSYGPRTMAVELALIVATPDDFATVRRSVLKSFLIQDQTELPFLVTPIGRELRCRPRRAQIPRDFDQYQRTGLAVVEMFASDRWWYDASDTALSFALGSSPATFFPLFPLRLSSSQVLASTTVNNGGDTVAWPVWTVTGPGSGLTIRNLTTGQQLTVAAALTAGEVLTVDTRPGAKSVIKGTATNLFGSLTGSLFPLAKGSNTIEISLVGATAASSVGLRYRRRWGGLDA